MTPIHAATPAQLAQHARIKAARERLGFYGPVRVKIVHDDSRERALQRELDEAREEIIRLRSEAAKLMSTNAELQATIERNNPTLEYEIALRLARAAVEEAAARHGVPVPAIYTPTRREPVVAARHEAIGAVRRINPHWSLPRLGRFFGGRDHTTILHALHKQGLA